MPGVVGIRFRDNGRPCRVNPADFTLMVGERVIVETAQGREMGIVVQTRRPLLAKENEEDFPRVLRVATAEDLAQYEANCLEEQEAFNVCRDLIDERGLDMFLVAAEYTYDERKLLFYFTAEGRIDFRDLVRDLAARFRVRIELRQIGVRDDAKMNGGMGICGRELCCSSWMDTFVPVSIRMAKEQNISMNPTKVSGNCGRLLCCLNYENDTYKANRKLLPKQGSLIDTPEGKAKVIQTDILGLKLTLLPQNPDGSWGTAYQCEAEALGWGKVRQRKLEEAEQAKAREKEREQQRRREEEAAEASEADGTSEDELTADETADAASEKASCRARAEGKACGCPKKKAAQLDLTDNTLVASAEHDADGANDAEAAEEAAEEETRGDGERAEYADEADETAEAEGFADEAGDGEDSEHGEDAEDAEDAEDTEEAAAGARRGNRENRERRDRKDRRREQGGARPRGERDGEAGKARPARRERDARGGRKAAPRGERPERQDRPERQERPAGREQGNRRPEAGGSSAGPEARPRQSKLRNGRRSQSGAKPREAGERKPRYIIHPKGDA